VRVERREVAARAAAVRAARIAMEPPVALILVAAVEARATPTM
jgi:hypothetical protein